MRTDLKYPLVWVEERVATNLRGEVILSRLAMAADHVVVHYEAAMSQAAIADALSGIGRVPRWIPRQDALLLALPSAGLDSVPQVLAAINARAGKSILMHEPDHVVTTSATPNDPLFTDGMLWGLHNTGQNSGTADKDIDAPEGWNTRTNAHARVLAVIDNGVRYTHEDLADNMWVNPGEIPGNGLDDDDNGTVDDVHGFNAITGSGDPMDHNKHGSHCAGTIAGRANNRVGVAGVAWNAKIMALKFLSANGAGHDSDAAECITYAIANGPRVLSNSWRGGGFSQLTYDAINSARALGFRNTGWPTRSSPLRVWRSPRAGSRAIPNTCLSMARPWPAHMWPASLRSCGPVSRRERDAGDPSRAQLCRPHDPAGLGGERQREPRGRAGGLANRAAQ